MKGMTHPLRKNGAEGRRRFHVVDGRHDVPRDAHSATAVVRTAGATGAMA